ncbi:tail fiber protein [Methanovulcanius yangii]|uniref:tail fiber protein n=1 Tax=Methanovulcanius yangii TaxID=1789227 RepID=UPI0029C9E636|nr:tail fiber protein [Methanovulcanius yangii]
MKKHFLVGGILILAVLVLAGTAVAAPPEDQKLSVEEIRGELVAIQSEIDEINEHLDEGADLSEIEARISTIEANITVLEGALALLEGNVSTLEGDMQTLTGTEYATEVAGGSQAHENRAPYMGLNYIICMQGLYPARSFASASGDDEGLVVASGIGEGTLGEVTLFAGNFAPRNWAFCQGQLLPISQNAALFSILGTTYGGDGRTTFALPDLRGRVVVGDGYGPGLSSVRLGQTGGVEQVTLTTSQLPAHLHGFSLYL